MNKENYLKRYEYKYLIDRDTYIDLLTYLRDYVNPDEYPESEICNVYYDTDNYRLIRRSLEKPIYKEKLRLRSYCVPNNETPVFLEIKKKFDDVVYKRRITIQEKDAINYMAGGERTDFSQVGNEIDYFKNFYKDLKPKMYLGYTRHSFVGKTDTSLRITFDEDIIWRIEDVNLESGKYGNRLIDKNLILMEIKIQNSIPLWLTKYLTKHKIYKTSFSKYGKAYRKLKENL